jgi:hypothetical protein
VSAAGKTQEFAFDTTGSKGDNVATDPNPTTGLFAFETCCRKGDNMGWVEYVWEFEAVAEKTTLEFYTAMTTDPNFGPALDDVRVVAVPGKK